MNRLVNEILYPSFAVTGVASLVSFNVYFVFMVSIVYFVIIAKLMDGVNSIGHHEP